jgi:hypothetical protein
MSKKQSREAELNTSEIERVRARLRETLLDIEELETRLQDEERKCGITPAPSKPVVERMAAVGMPREAIDQLADMLDTLTQIAPRIEIIPKLNAGTKQCGIWAAYRRRCPSRLLKKALASDQQP